MTIINQTKDKIFNLETVLDSLIRQENIFEKFYIKTLDKL